MLVVAKRVEVSSYDKAVEGILNHIDICDMRCGDAFPPERELCDEIGVSRTMLRSALTHLTSTHVIERRQGSDNYPRQRRPTVQLDDLSGFSQIVWSIGESRPHACSPTRSLPLGLRPPADCTFPRTGPSCTWNACA